MRWLLSQRWDDLLFAHWPVSPRVVERLLPEADTLAEAQFQGGQAEQGRQTLREALKLRPSDKALGG